MTYLASGLIALALVVGSYFVAPETYDRGTSEPTLGAVSYPTSLDTFTNPSSGDTTNSPSHSTQHSDANDAIEALQAKVGADSSAVTTSHDYKLSGVTGSDLACSLAGTETLTNKTLTSPGITGMTATTSTLIGTTTLSSGGNPISIDLGSDATNDIFYRDASGNFSRLAVGAEGEVLKITSGDLAWGTAGAGSQTASTTGPLTGASVSTTFTLDDTDQDYMVFMSGGCDTTGAGAAGFQTYINGKLVQDYDFQAITNTNDTFISTAFASTTATTTTIIARFENDGNCTAFNDTYITVYQFN
jgi:hypothetical protein